MSVDVLIANNLSVGKKISSKDYEKIKSDENYKSIMAKALNFLSYRPRSKKEVESSLFKKGFDDKSISKVIEDLSRKGYLDDNLFARTYATHLIKIKMLGRVAVLNRFFIHQIEADMLNIILNELYEKFPPKLLIQKIMKKKRVQRGTDLSKSKKIIDHLKRKGFSWDEISNSLNI